MASSRFTPALRRHARKLSGLARKAGWRIRLLHRPDRYALTHTVLDRADARVQPTLLDEAARLPLRVRLRLAARRGDPRISEELLLRRIRTAPDGARYFDFGDARIFFDVGETTDDADALARGVLTILHEAYFETPNFLRYGVQARAGDTVLDLGGNVGTSTLYFSRIVGDHGRVYSFEPIFDEPLERTLRENAAHNVEAVPQAVGEEPTRVPFSVHALGIDSRLATREDRDATKIVDMTTVDEFVARRGIDRVDLIKMDIEGAEELALRGAAETLERDRPHLTIASYHTDPEGRRQHPRLLALLADSGYEVRTEGTSRIYAW
jgi:FkbM family methyltransferase